MNAVEKILEELFAFDPNLKTHEKELRLLVEQSLAAKPETPITQEFILSLKNKLALQASQEKNNYSYFNFMKKPLFAYGGMGMALVVLLLVFLVTNKPKTNNQTLTKESNTTEQTKQTDQPVLVASLNKSKPDIKAFSSEEEYKKYVSEAITIAPTYEGRGGGLSPSLTKMDSIRMSESNLTATAPSMQGAPASDSVTRFSETNTQVLNIDEPDILKNNGKQIFYSSQNHYPIYEPMDLRMPESPLLEEAPIESKIAPWPQPTYKAETKVINAVPLSELKTLGKIDKQGDLLLSDKNLLILNYQGIFGYDISDPAKPKEIWNMKYQDSQLETARLTNGKLYLVTKSYPNFDTPCPLKPMILNEKAIEVPCANIYHPTRPTSGATNFNTFVIDPSSGEVKNKTTFVGGSYGHSITYMSENALYITFTKSKPQLEALLDFFASKGRGVISETALTRLQKLQNYDISEQAKNVEMGEILQSALSGLSSDDQAKFQNEIQNKISEYLKEKKRELTSSGIVKISLNNLTISATGEVPGTPLNQFSLDEYQGKLRIATNIGQNYWLWNYYPSTNDSANDVYVLDEKLNISGLVTDLGKTEQIYSVRFLGNRGYVVTFRQTDPFYVLDLSNPQKPEVKGELKIPGFSSYLHPLADNLILGIGQESGKVKLSLFDVENPTSPVEKDKYLLNEYYSEAQNNHHAFLQDKKHNAFFLPGSQSGFVFSYKNNKLNLEKVVSKVNAKRALYINDFLYIVGDDKIVVLDENNWERVKELDLK